MTITSDDYYDIPEHMGCDLRLIADEIDQRVGYKTADAEIIRKAASCFDQLSKDATYSDAIDNLKKMLRV